MSLHASEKERYMSLADEPPVEHLALSETALSVLGRRHRERPESAGAERKSYSTTAAATTSTPATTTDGGFDSGLLTPNGGRTTAVHPGKSPSIRICFRPIFGSLFFNLF